MWQACSQAAPPFPLFSSRILSSSPKETLYRFLFSCPSSLCKLNFRLYTFAYSGHFICRWTLFYYCLYRVLQTLRFILKKPKVCGSLASRKSVSMISSTAVAPFMSLWHVLVILTMFRTFSSLLFFLRQSVIRDLCCFYYDSGSLRWCLAFVSNEVFLNCSICIF